MAKTTLDDLLKTSKTLAPVDVTTIENVLKENKTLTPETVLLYKEVGNLLRITSNLNLWQRNPDFINGDCFQIYFRHPNYNNSPYISSFPPIRQNIEKILWSFDMANQKSNSEEDSHQRDSRLTNYRKPIRIEVAKLYKDVTITVPKKRKSAIFLLEGDVWVLTSRKATTEQMLHISDIRHGEQGLWLKAMRERSMFSRRLLGENTGILTGNILRSTIIPQKDSLVVVVDYD